MSELRAEFTALKTTLGSRDPVRLRYIESLLSKAEQVNSQLAPVIAAKVSAAMADYRENTTRPAVLESKATTHRNTGLSDLVELLNDSQAEEHDPNLAPLEQQLRQQERDLVGEITEQSQQSDDRMQMRQEELKAARRFQSAMVKLNADKVVTQAIAEIPEHCGPLNPQRLATRSLETMRDLSPHYLSRFVSYIDTLFWLENADRRK